MSVRQSGAAAILRLVTHARRWPPVARLYGRLPSAWKARIARKLLRLVVGGTQVPAAPSLDIPREDATLPVRRLDSRFEGCGTNLWGYIRSEFGLGESVRLYALALAEQGFPFALLNYEVPPPARAQDCSLDAWLATGPEHPVSVYFVNPDQMLRARARLEEQKRQGRYLIGFWYWELEKFPEEWRPALELVDEVWTASTFVQQSIGAATHKPVLRMPLPIQPEGVRPDRSCLGLPEDCFAFLYTFDYHSWPQRKNAQGVIAAFRAAFAVARDNVRLLIKTTNAERVADAHLDLVDAARGDPRIVFRDEHLSRSGMYGLIASADAYISLHRSEGFGLGMAEAMYFGKPVIATRYSGNLDFMTDEVARLVDCEMVKVPPGAYPHWQGQCWAEPDVGIAASHMRWLVDHPVAARALGAAAAARIRRQYARPACTAAVIDRVQAIAGGQMAAAASPRTSTT